MATTQKKNVSDEEAEWRDAGAHEVYAGDYDFADDYDEDDESEGWRVFPPPFAVAVKNAALISAGAVLAFLAGMYAVIYIAARFGGR